MRVAFKGISGVENVNVSLNKGLADVDFKPGNTVAFRQLQDAITKNGFTTKQSIVVVRGAIENMNGKYLLKVSNTTDSFELDGDRSQPEPRYTDLHRGRTTFARDGRRGTSVTPDQFPCSMHSNCELRAYVPPVVGTENGA